jgi:hypothetical protein
MDPSSIDKPSAVMCEKPNQRVLDEPDTIEKPDYGSMGFMDPSNTDNPTSYVLYREI